MMLDDDLVQRDLLNLVVGGRYRIIRKIGSGAFGHIYLGIELESETEVAIKVEPIRTRYLQLPFESRVYIILKHHIGFPNLRYYGTERDYNILVMDLLGPTIEDLFNVCGRNFTLKTVLMIVDQIISRLEFIHSKGIIHRDIKPDNLVIGLGPLAKHVIMIDFGLAKFFREPKTRKHIPYREDKGLVGTPRYCSRRAHFGVEQTRRDDLESLGYVILYLLKSQLPWQNIKGVNRRQKLDRISECKNATRFEKVLKGYPVEFCTFLYYTRQLRFDELPDYMYLRNLFRILFRVWSLKWDFKYDWIQNRK